MVLSTERQAAERTDGRPAHPARHFAAAPDSAAAHALLDRINDGLCAFSPELPGRPLVLYGAGNMGRLARDHLRLVGLDVTMTVDRQADRLAGDPAWDGVLLARPQDVPAAIKKDSLLAVSVATSAYAPLERALLDDGWAHVVPFYDLAESFRDRHPLSNGWFAGPLSEDDMEATRTVLSGWDDDTSRAHHLQFIAWRRLREEWTFEDAPVPNCARFFIPEIVALLTNHETFIDAGAHHGSVTGAFLAHAPNGFSSIVAIEPDLDSVGHLETYIATLPAETSSRISIRTQALDASIGNRTFHSGLGYASQLSDTCEKLVETTTLDALVLAPSFIKLHLEGAEYDALTGGLDTIRQHRPILAITTYHNDDGIWKTPLFLMDALDDYRFILRLHSWCGTGAVVYGIPVERMA